MHHAAATNRLAILLFWQEVKSFLRRISLSLVYEVFLLITAMKGRARARTTDTRKLNPEFFAARIQIPIRNKYLGCGCKGLVFCKING